MLEAQSMDKRKQPPILDDYCHLAMMKEQRIVGNFMSNGFAGKDLASICPKVSLVTVVRNGENTLRHTIKSVLDQSYGNIEYIVVDGASTDGTLDIIREYEERVIRWISEPDGGISDAFNKGVTMCTGDIIGFVNADDWLEPGTVETVVAQMGKIDEPTIVHGMIQYWSEKGRESLVAGDHALLEKNMTVNHPTVFASSECYRRFGLFRLDFRCAMDYEWLLRARTRGARFSYIPRVLVNMRLGGVSDRKWRLAIQEVARAKSLHTGKKLTSYAYYLVQLAKGSGQRMLSRIGLDFIVRFYHGYFSLVKKTRN
jgi:glycosyltransferase involved in cell wall biosynthesis